MIAAVHNRQWIHHLVAISRHPALMGAPTPPAPESAPADVSRCPTCKAPATPHCNGKFCHWLTCTESDCRITWRPDRPELGSVILNPDKRYRAQ